MERNNASGGGAAFAAPASGFARGARNLLLASSLLVAGGCQQGLYRAATLPAQFSAPAVTDSQTIDLSRLARAAVRTELIYPGDVLEISVATGMEEGSSSAWTLRVNEQGLVNVPLVGPVQLVGLELPQAERVVRDESIRRGIYREPNVSVLLKQRRVNRITVVGEVQEPSTYELPAPNSDLLAALVAAGGLTEDADTVVEIKHPTTAAAGPLRQAGYTEGEVFGPGSRAIRVDLTHPEGAAGNDLKLDDGSVVMVMRKPVRAVQVIGLVKQPKEIEMPLDKDLRLLDALAQAGDRTMQIADTVHIIRQIDAQGGGPVVIEASVKEAKKGGPANLRLADGDVVSVEETPVTFMVGTIRDFVRFGFSSAIPGF